jgi:hypothetical protein
MHFTSFIVAAAAAFHVAQADFMVYTVPPIPTDSIPKFTDPAEVCSSPSESLSTPDTAKGFGLDPQRRPKRQPRIHILYQLARSKLPVVALVCCIRDRRLCTVRLKLHDSG